MNPVIIEILSEYGTCKRVVSVLSELMNQTVMEIFDAQSFDIL